VADHAVAGHQNADLAPGLARDLGKVAREFVGDDAVRRDAAAERPVERLALRGLQAVQIAGDGLSRDRSVSAAKSKHGFQYDR
jgi:hypothetical protein